MSTPSALRRPDDTAPSLRGAAGYVCPTCRKRYDEEAASGVAKCPADGAILILVRDLAEADGDPMLGRTLGGRFTILSRLGAGSMGTVYRARQHPVGRDVAIKILRSERAIDEVSRARFLREARANSLLASPNTVTVFDFGQSESGDFFLAMEMLEGESLGQRLKRMGRLPPDVAVETTRQALRSLAEAHAKGIIHRDLKPDNLFYARVPDGGASMEMVKVLDFGIAKMLRDPTEPFNAVETQAGTVFGTPRYMSPEQAQAKPLDARSDLYSLGVILYHMIAGRPPYTDDDAIVVMARHIKSVPKPLSEVCPEAIVAPEIEKAIMRALSKEPSGRPESAEAMAVELLRALESDLASTSGVRMSMTGRRLSAPPVSFLSGGTSTLATPSPMSLPIPSKGATGRSAANRSNSAVDSLELEPPVTSTRRLRGVALSAGAAVVAAAVLVAFAMASRVVTPAVSTLRPSPTAASAAVPPTLGGDGQSSPLSGSPSSTQTVDVEALPVARRGASVGAAKAESPATSAERARAATGNGAKLPPRGAPAPSPNAAIAPAPAAAAAKNPRPTGSASNYGLFE